MNFVLAEDFGGECVRAGARAVLQQVLGEDADECQLKSAGIIVRAGADLSNPAVIRWVRDLPANRHFLDISAVVRVPPDDDTAAALRDIRGRFSLVTVQDRHARELLANLGIEAPLLPCAAYHGWRLRGGGSETAAAGATVHGAADRRVAVNTGVDERDLAIASALEAQGFKSVSDIYPHCDAAVTGGAETAALLAGRGVPSILIGEDPAVDELGLPRYSESEASADTVVARLQSMLNDGGATRRRLLALERRSFRTHCDAVRNALGKPDASTVLDVRLAAIRHRLSLNADEPPPREVWVDAVHLLTLEGEEFVHEAYRTLFGRTADPQGLRHWTTVLAEGTSKEQCLTAMAESDEGRRLGVRLRGFAGSTEEFLREVALGNVSPESLARWMELIDRGKVSRGEAARLIAASVGPAHMAMAIADLRREMDWQRRAIEWLLPSAK